MRRRQFIIVDFPAPVRPTIPIFSPLKIDILIFFKISGRPSRYFVEQF